MPKIGQAMAEGIVLQWHKQDGAHVTAGEILVTIETDKATYDLEAQASGILRISVGEGHEVKVGTVIGMIGNGPQQATPSAAAVSTPTGASLPAAQAPARGKKVLASPKAKQLAAAHGVDLATIAPSGADGVISAGDVERTIAEKTTPVPVAPAKASTTGKGVREQRPLVGIRKTAARRVQEAWQTIPHIVQMVEVDATALRVLRASLRT